MRVNLGRSLRRIRPERFSRPLRRRPDEDLPFVEGEPAPGPALLLDTCVYIDVLQDALPEAAQALVRTRPSVCLSVVLGELSHNFGRLTPGHPRTAETLKALAALIETIVSGRVDDAVTSGVSLEAGILAGLMLRLGGFQPGQEVAAVNDATIYLHALEKGYIVLTRNMRDFDLMQQVMPQGRVIFYRQTAGA